MSQHRLGVTSPSIILSTLIEGPSGSKTVGALVDSGSDCNLLDWEVARSLGIRAVPLTNPLRAVSLESTPLSKITHISEPVRFIVSGNHTESLRFHLFDAPHNPVVLGKAWLSLHDPHISFRSGKIKAWGVDCHANCLRSAPFSDCSPKPSSTRPTDLSSVPTEYHDLAAVFDKTEAISLPPHRPYDCAINLVPGAKLPTGRLYSISRPEQSALKDYISQSLASGIIRPSSSPLAAGFFFVKKKDGSLRPCIDFRQLNDITVKNKYPLPLLSSSFEPLVGSTIFSKLDLRNAYHLVRIKEGDEWKTAFNTPLGHFEYLVLPFGLTNAPAVFQCLVNDVLRDMINVFVVVYLDDLLIFSKSRDEHVVHVRLVLQRLLENRLFVKAEKCEFHTTSLEFLGHIVQEGKVSTDPKKVRAVREWPVPRSRLDLQRFLGFANFYRRFIMNFSSIAAPLCALTSTRVAFSWTPEADRAFSFLKDAFSSAPVLAYPDPDRPFIVEVDASDSGVGAVLSQRDAVSGKIHPCAFFSRRLSPAERNYAVGDRELLAAHAALSEWRHWLEGARFPFSVLTDHKNLVFIRSVKRVSARQARWASFFSRFDFTISFKPGSANAKADALSRLYSGSSEARGSDLPVLAPGVLLGGLEWEVVAEVRRAQVSSSIPSGLPAGKLFVPLSLRSRVLAWGHSSRLACHPGVARSISFIGRVFWWPSFRKDVRRFVAACPTCCRAKSDHASPAGLLRPLPVPDRPWSCIAVDFVSGLPVSQGMSVVLTVVDRFSKMVHFVPLPKLPSAAETADLLVAHVFRIHGLPSDILSDRGPQFISRVWSSFGASLGATVSRTSGYHPQTNGQCERANQSLESALRCLCHQKPSSWVAELPWIELSLNSMVNSSTGLSPFEAALGYQPPLLPEQEVGLIGPSVPGGLRRVRRIWRRVRAAVSKSNRGAARAANRRRRASPTYRVGQRVWLRARDVTLPATNKKLAPRFIGPYEITRIVNPVTVRLALPSHMLIHPIFHVSQAKPVRSSALSSPCVPPPLPCVVGGGPAYRVKEILAVRRMGRGHQYLVEWEGYGPEDRSWVPRSFILDPGLLSTFYSTRPVASSTPPGGGVVGGGAPVMVSVKPLSGRGDVRRRSARLAGSASSSHASPGIPSPNRLANHRESDDVTALRPTNQPRSRPNKRHRQPPVERRVIP